MRVILDTNFLTLPAQFKVDIFGEIGMLLEGGYQLYIMEGTVAELERLAGSQKEDAKAAKIALRMLETRGVKVLPSKESYVDDAILEAADGETIVATNDRKLIKKLKDKSIKVIFLRGKNRLSMG
ncbi:hypothetical protein A3K63_01770 [Candidatus Micrarchaeota archaeon RBG_16_49_10]|nr:MAG: hypothetical protein A3K63_01770 [Candidatus Micrarchaeota archaeon RBG_16_49_10]